MRLHGQNEQKARHRKGTAHKSDKAMLADAAVGERLLTADKHIGGTTGKRAAGETGVLGARLVAVLADRPGCSGIDQALITAPVSVTGIVMGKFLAAFGVYFIANTLALLPAITMGFFSSAFPWGILFGNYIGTLLYGAAMISIGVFISGLTISQVIAAIGTFVIAIFLMFVDQIASALSGNFIGTILTWISFTSRYDTFTQGIFSVSSCVYFISVAAVFVFLTARRVESRRWN